MSYKSLSDCLKCSIGLIFLLFYHTGSAQSGELDRYIDQQSKNYAGNMVVMAWKGDSLLYQKATGEYNINTQESVGEAGAWFTAALVMHYVDQGKISLDDPVARYLPIFEKYAKGYLTIRHCLENTTGLEGDKAGLTRMIKKSRFESLEEEVDSYASKREILNNPGIDYNYNQIGLSIAGRVLEVVGKKSFDRLMTEKIFRPLGMRKSTFTAEYSVSPFSGAKTSPADYIRFMNMLMQGGTLNGKTVLTPESVQVILSLWAEKSKMVYSPEFAAGFSPSAGSWIITKNREGKPTVFTSPAQQGIWPWLDQCRNYSAVIFIKGPAKTPTRPLFEAIKPMLDALAGGNCE